MRRMLNPDKVIKSIKIADDKAVASIGKENFRLANDAYFVNIQTISQSGWDASGYVYVNVNGLQSDIMLFRNNVYTIGAYQNGTDVMIVGVGVVYDAAGGVIEPEFTHTVEDATVEDVLTTIELISLEDFDLYVLKD